MTDPSPWENPKLTIPVKVAVYNTCIVSTFLYGVNPGQPLPSKSKN